MKKTPNDGWYRLRAWLQIEARLRNIGSPDNIFDADADERIAAAVERFKTAQNAREASGLERRELPEDLRELLTGELPWWLKRLQTRIEWDMNNAVRNAALSERRRVARVERERLAALEQQGGEEE